MAKRVVVGMSGGVDSSVAALLLNEQGYELECLFMKNWEDEDTDTYCTSEADYQDALQVCETLSVPLHSVNFAREYRDKVFAYFLQEYRSGRTPNPDVLCNKEIKFKAFLNYALELGADIIATGHYARISKTNGTCQLLKGRDKSKDQSYFLYLLGQKELSQSLFPVGDMNKEEVRQLAKDNGLAVHHKKDSTGICFIGERKFKEFLKRYLPAQPGDIVTTSGQLAGRHEGLMYYTIGQRKGIGVGGGFGKAEAPWYVVERELESNRLVIAQGHDHPQLFSTGLSVSQLHWIGGQQPALPAHIHAKIRYRQKDQQCTIESISNGQAIVTFDESQFAVAPGQSVVFYDGDICRGGGIIEEAISDAKT